MKKKITIAILALLMLLPGAVAYAAPFIICDPQATVTHYKITGDAYWTADIPAQADGSIRTDVGGIASGEHNIQVVACRADALWGEACSAPTPFSFTRPSGPTAPASFRLAP